MAVVTANNAIYVQSSQPSAVQHITTMDNSNAIYDRDKQIYKCSTLGRHVKFDGQRQNLVPAVIPTVPQIPKYNGQPQNVTTTSAAPTSISNATISQQQQHQMMMANNQHMVNNVGGIKPSIQNCPLPDIPSVGTFKPANDLGGSAVNDLPHNR
jgi:hypothetical protein